MHSSGGSISTSIPSRLPVTSPHLVTSGGSQNRIGNSVYKWIWGDEFPTPTTATTYPYYSYYLPQPILHPVSFPGAVPKAASHLIAATSPPISGGGYTIDTTSISWVCMCLFDSLCTHHSLVCNHWDSQSLLAITTYIRSQLAAISCIQSQSN